jgi:EAL domain-containing protein (putative c-di-GMP-specific phosphodiesterase class I)
MDDFGSGHSSLTNLRMLPLDVIKIDKSFVHGIAADKQDRAIVAGIVQLGHDTDRGVIAEGVESQELHAELVSLGCDLAQGFLSQRPIPASEVTFEGFSGFVTA